MRHPRARRVPGAARQEHPPPGRPPTRGLDHPGRPRGGGGPACGGLHGLGRDCRGRPPLRRGRAGPAPGPPGAGLDPHRAGDRARARGRARGRRRTRGRDAPPGHQPAPPARHPGPRRAAVPTDGGGLAGRCRPGVPVPVAPRRGPRRGADPGLRRHGAQAPAGHVARRPAVPRERVPLRDAPLGLRPAAQPARRPDRPAGARRPRGRGHRHRAGLRPGRAADGPVPGGHKVLRHRSDLGAPRTAETPTTGPNRTPGGAQ